MDLSYSEEQQMLKDSARKFLQKECSLEFVRRMWGDETGLPEDIWKQFSELGWLGLCIPEEYDGAGLGFTEMSIILEEMGRAALPGPFLSTVLCAELINDAGSNEQKAEFLSGIGDGEIKGSLAIAEPDFNYSASGINLPAKLEGDCFILNGTKQFVLDGMAADVMIVAVRTGENNDPEQGITLLLVDNATSGTRKLPLILMDGGRKQCEVIFENAKIPVSKVLGEINKGWPALKRTLDKAVLALAMENLGGADKALEIAVEYAKTRVQFDQPIGSFQAIKQMCADLLVEVEGTRSICAYGVWSIDNLTEQESELTAYAAKAYSSDMYRKVTADSTQIQGAMGVSWENDMHIYLKRAKMNEFLFADPTYCRERIAQLLDY